MFNILIVDDNAAFRQSLHQILAQCFSFMRVDEVADGETALHRMSSLRPDLIFMDIRLPGLSGLDLTKIIKSIYAHTLICVVTSYDLQEYRDAALSSGADHFIVKDRLSKTEIVAIVGGLLSSNNHE